MLKKHAKVSGCFIIVEDSLFNSAFRTSLIKDNRGFTHDSPGRSVNGISDV